VSLPLVHGVFRAFSVQRALCLVVTVVTFALGACSRDVDRTHVIRVSIPEQRMALYHLGREVARYPVSTSKFGVGDVSGSNCTPLGVLEVAEKIGGNAPLGMKFKNRRPTGEIVAVNAPGRDPIVTRILWLRGLESENANAFERMIYIHGTPEEYKLGVPASFGCIRMGSKDVADLYEQAGRGARVEICMTNLPPPPVIGKGPEEAQTVAAQASLDTAPGRRR